MKYYKCKGNSDRKLLKQRIKEFTSRKKFNYKAKIFSNYIIVFLFIIEMAGIIILAKNMKYMIENQILATILSVILWILCLPLPTIISLFLIFLINLIFPTDPLPQVTAKMILSLNQKKFNYYKLGDTYITTKCYQSNYTELNNKDVLICFKDEKILITNDFYHSIYDFGCFEFDFSELNYFNIKEDNLVKTKIMVEENFFILGYRCKTFLEQNSPKRRFKE